MKLSLAIVNNELIRTASDGKTVDFVITPKESMSEVLERVDAKIDFNKYRDIEIVGSFTSYTTERNFTAVMNTIAQVRKIKLIREGSSTGYILPVYSGGANVTMK